MTKEKKELTPLAEELRVIARIDSAVRHLSIDAKERVLGYVQMAVIEERVLREQQRPARLDDGYLDNVRVPHQEVNHG